MLLHLIRSVRMGKGDQRSAKGKRFRGTFGKRRPHKRKKKVRIKLS